MPDILSGSGKTFELASSSVQSLLNRYKGIDFKNLTRKDLVRFERRNFKKGWLIRDRQKSQDFCEFFLFLDDKFPYSRIYSALTSDTDYLRLPHVEEDGVLCISLDNQLSLEGRLNEVINNTIDLIIKLKNSSFVEQEMKQEFISYWNLSIKEKHILAAINLKSTKERVIYSTSTIKSLNNEDSDITVIGETKESIAKWIENYNPEEKKDIKKYKKVIFFFNDDPIIPPYPEIPQSFFEYLNKNHPSILNNPRKFSIDENLGFLIATRLKEGIGLVYFEITKPKRDGFYFSGRLLKKPHKSFFSISYRKMIETSIWTRGNKLIRRSIERIDAAWIHNRDKDPVIYQMTEKHILLLGCGSIGSQVAFRLGQSGIGKITLVDPQRLVSANVGRHALGINSITLYKATSMTLGLKKHFPHSTFIDYADDWQNIFKLKPDFLEGVDLIVSCMGDWEAEGMLNEFLLNQKFDKPIVYGWIGEGGTTAHAVSFFDKKPSLSCILDSNGNLKEPEILLNTSSMMQSEPACGTMFQPYGAIDAAHAEVLISRLCVDILTEKSTSSVHRVYACSEEQLAEAQQKWSAEHLNYRPKNFSYSFEYEKMISSCEQCIGCKSWQK